ncbi:pyridoxal-phosphate dependent enzyme [candidate division KSB1 bacterium]
MDNIPDLKTINEAQNRIKPFIHKTPVLTNNTINKMAGCEIFFKCENMQKCGAFKMRGASNAVFSLTDEEAQKGVITHSSGNHAGALALAARNRNIPAYIIMPENAPKVKIAAVEGYGGQITFCEPTLQARESTAEARKKETGAVMIHPYDDYRIIAGASTAAAELIDEVSGLDFILAPVGGGGLISGTAISSFYMDPEIKVIACEPENANDAYLSFKKGEIVKIGTPDTVADGLRTMLSDKTFGIISRYVNNIVTVTEDEIIGAMKMIWERMKVIIEPSSAVPVAVAISKKADLEKKRIGLILSGGNVDLGKLPF